MERKAELHAARSSSSCPPTVASKLPTQAEQAEVIRKGFRWLDGLGAAQAL